MFSNTSLSERAKREKLTLRGVQLRFRVVMSCVQKKNARTWVIARASWTVFNLTRAPYYCPATNWRASEACETLSGVHKFELMRYIYIYMYGGTCAIIGERAKRARHYQGCTNSSWCGIYIYIYIFIT